MSDINDTSQVQTFNFNAHGVRALTIDGEPWFVAVDVANVLALANMRSSVALLDDDERGVHSMDTPGGPQQFRVISESGLYSLILKSRRPEAKEFKRWITREVLPEIRRTGRYHGAEMTRLEILDLARESELARIQEVKAREAAECYARTLEPGAEAYAAFMDSDGTYSVGSVAKMLGISQNRLYDELRARGVMIAKGHMRNTPYQKFMQYFRVKAFEYERADGTHGVSYTTRVLPAGVDWIRRRLNIAQPVMEMPA